MVSLLSLAAWQPQVAQPVAVVAAAGQLQQGQQQYLRAAWHHAAHHQHCLQQLLQHASLLPPAWGCCRQLLLCHWQLVAAADPALVVVEVVGRPAHPDLLKVQPPRHPWQLHHLNLHLLPLPVALVAEVVQ